MKFDCSFNSKDDLNSFCPWHQYNQITQSIISTYLAFDYLIKFKSKHQEL